MPEAALHVRDIHRQAVLAVVDHHADALRRERRVHLPFVDAGRQIHRVRHLNLVLRHLPLHVRKGVPEQAAAVPLQAVGPAVPHHLVELPAGDPARRARIFLPGERHHAGDAVLQHRREDLQVKPLVQLREHKLHRGLLGHLSVVLALQLLHLIQQRPLFLLQGNHLPLDLLLARHLLLPDAALFHDQEASAAQEGQEQHDRHDFFPHKPYSLHPDYKSVCPWFSAAPP